MTFQLDISTWVKKAKGDVDKAVRYVLIAIPKNIIKRNPVGDANYWKSKPPKGYAGGRSRANWQYGNGVMPTSTINAVDKSGSKTLAKIVGQVESSPTAAIHWYSNNLPYIKRLEDGYSRQAPNGMVGITILEFQQIVREAAKNVSR